MHPYVMNLFRILAAGAVLVYAHKKNQERRNERFFEPLKKYPFELIRLGIIGWALYQFAFIVGLDHTTAGTAAILMASLPLWTALLSFAMGVERLNYIMWGGLALTMIGTTIVVLSGSQEVDMGSDYLIGNLIMLLAAMLWAANTVFTKALVDRVTPIGITVLALIVSIPFLAAVSIPYWQAVEWDRINWLIWIALIFSGSLSTGVAIVFWNSAVKQMGASHTAAFQNLVPLIALLTSFFVLNENILLGQIVGGTLTIGGLVIMRRGRKK